MSQFKLPSVVPLVVLSGGLLIFWAKLPAASCAEEQAAPEELLELVGPNAGLCLEISDLNRRLPEFANSPLAERVEKLPFFLAWKQTQEFQKLSAVRTFVERQTGQPLRQFVMNLFGESVVLAVYPQDPGEPTGVLLLRAANGNALQKALASWNREERIKLETIEHGPGRYVRRMEQTRAGKAAGRPHFYVVQGAVFALSDDETAIRDVLDRALGRTDQPALNESLAYQAARASLSADCWATVYFNPRAWKTDWPTGTERSPVEKWLAEFWQRSQAVALGVKFDQGLVVDVVLHYDPTGQPTRWRQVVERTQGFPKFLNQVPARALVVLAGRQDLAGLDQWLTAEQTPKEQQEWQNARQITRGLLLGRDLFTEIVPQFLPNWGAYLAPRESLDAGAVPVEGLLALELPPKPDYEEPVPIRQALENALNTGLNLLAAVQNSRENAPLAQVKSRAEGTTRVHWVDSVGPYRPAYALTADSLIFASSPAMVDEFLSADTPKLTASPTYRLWSEKHGQPEGQVLFASWQAVRKFLSKHREFLLDQAVESHALERDDAKRRLARLEEVLNVFDAVSVGLQIQESQIRLRIGGLTAN